MAHLQANRFCTNYSQQVIKNGEMLGVSHLRNRRVLSNGFALLGKENLQLMYSDGDKAFGTSSELCLDERLRIASDGIIVVSMEILRPKNADGLSRPRIKGKIRITTRCLWVDKGKLLDALHKAAHAALSSCPINCPTAHIERTVSEVLRKMVRKYSSKRPEVIAVAVESTMGALSDEPRPRLSGEYHDSFGLSAMNKVANAPSRKEGSSRRLEEVNGGDANLSYDLVEEDTEGKDVEFEQLLSEENIRNPDLATPPSSTLTESADFWELSGVPESANGENGSVEHEKSTETVNENSKKSLKSQAAASKPAKRNEWKPEEIKRLIKMRGEMDSRFQTVKARMVLWEEISATLMEHGIKQTPGQCKSLWSSLVKKYKENRTGKISMRSWPYFDDLDKILCAHEEPTK